MSGCVIERWKTMKLKGGYCEARMNEDEDKRQEMMQILGQAQELMEEFFDTKSRTWKYGALLEEYSDQLRILSTRAFVSSRGGNAPDIRGCANTMFLLGYQAGLRDNLDIWRDQL